MSRTSATVAGIATSAILAALTLSVFARNQFNGPEGALRRFVSAVQKADFDRTVEASRGRSRFALDQLATEVHSVLRAGGTFDVVEVRIQDARAFARVDMTVNRRTATTIWVLAKEGRRWYVDVDASARLRGWPV
jgi:hypothetical protein